MSGIFGADHDTLLAGLSTTNSSVASLSTSTSTGISSLSTGLSTTNSTVASLSTDRRRLLFEQLEQECPGITRLERDAEGAYLIDPRRSDAGEQLMASFGIFVAR